MSNSSKRSSVSLGALESGRHPPVLVLAETGGRLGNHLFNFLSWMVLARRHGWIIWNYGFKRYAKEFEKFGRQSPVVWPSGSPVPGRSLHALLTMVIGGAKWIEAKTRLRMDEQGDRVPGWLRRRWMGYLAFDWRQPGRFRKSLLRPRFESYEGPGAIEYVGAHALTLIDSNVSPVDFAGLDVGEIRRTFAPSREIADRVERQVSELRRSHDMLVGVHMRLTDFQTWEGGKHFVPPEGYAFAVRQHAKSSGVAKTAYVICSDETVDDRLFQGVDWRRGPGDAMGDLEMLTRCDRIISTESTFSAWASLTGQVPRHVIRQNGADDDAWNFKVFGSGG